MKTEVLKVKILGNYVGFNDRIKEGDIFKAKPKGEIYMLEYPKHSGMFTAIAFPNEIEILD